MITEFRGKYAFLSNFYPCAVEYEGLIFPTVEHAYQAAKTLNLGERLAIRNCETPGKAKRMGRAVTLRKNWNSIKLDVMLGLLRQKFGYPVLLGMLLATGNEHIQEGNDWGDRFWGVSGGVGENHLGRLLMQVRNELQAQHDVSNDDPCHDCDGVLQCKDCSTYGLLICPNACHGYNNETLCHEMVDEGDCPMEGESA